MVGDSDYYYEIPENLQTSFTVASTLSGLGDICCSSQLFNSDDELTVISVKTIPNSKRVAIKKLEENNYSVRLDKPAVEGKANIRLIEVLADYFDVPKSSVEIVKGFRNREKVVSIIQK